MKKFKKKCLWKKSDGSFIFGFLRGKEWTLYETEDEGGSYGFIGTSKAKMPRPKGARLYPSWNAPARVIRAMYDVAGERA